MRAIGRLLAIVGCLLATEVCGTKSSSMKIFVYSPRFALSHVKFMGRIADTLADEGHQVTVLQPVQNMEVANETGVVKSKVIIIEQAPEIRTEFARVWSEFRNPWVHEPHFPTLTESALHFAQQCNFTILHRDIMEKLKNEQFDVGISEGYDHCGPALLKILGCKSRVLASSTVSMESINARIGVPNIHSYVPVSVAKASDKMDFKTRLSSMITMLGIKYYYYRYRTELDKVLAYHYGPDFPDTHEIIGSSDLVLTNSHPYLDFPHPTLEKIVDIGGIGVDQFKPLNEGWSSILSLRPRTVFISFGSVAYSSLLPDAWRMGILGAMKKLPNTTFIWKYENPEENFANGVENVILTKWAPQVDLLNDHRLSLFITHGGLGSVMEVATAGKPALFVPLFADQYRNALMCERKGMSVSMKKEQLGDSEFLVETINRLIEDKRYLQNSRQTAKRILMRPLGSRDQLIKHIELAGQLGDLSFLEPEGRKMGFIEYFSIDIICLFTSIILLLISIAVIITYFLVSFILRLVAASIVKSKKD